MANGKKVKSKATKGTGAKKRTAAGGSGTGMSLKRTMKRVSNDGSRPQVMAQKKGGQGKKMMKTMTTRSVPRAAETQQQGVPTAMEGAVRGVAAGRAGGRAGVRGATIGATEGMSSIPFRNSFIQRMMSRRQD